jgi:hypothetical protein
MARFSGRAIGPTEYWAIWDGQGFRDVGRERGIARGKPSSWPDIRKMRRDARL